MSWCSLPGRSRARTLRPAPAPLPETPSRESERVAWAGTPTAGLSSATGCLRATQATLMGRYRVTGSHGKLAVRRAEWRLAPGPCLACVRVLGFGASDGSKKKSSMSTSNPPIVQPLPSPRRQPRATAKMSLMTMRPRSTPRVYHTVVLGKSDFEVRGWGGWGWGWGWWVGCTHGRCTNGRGRTINTGCRHPATTLRVDVRSLRSIFTCLARAGLHPPTNSLARRCGYVSHLSDAKSCFHPPSPPRPAGGHALRQSEAYWARRVRAGGVRGRHADGLAGASWLWRGAAKPPLGWRGIERE